MGLTYDKRRKSWNARITVSGKRVYLGSFPTEREALEAYLRVELFVEVAKHFTLQNFRVPYIEDDTNFKLLGSFGKTRLKTLLEQIEQMYTSVKSSVFRKKQKADTRNE